MCGSVKFPRSIDRGLIEGQVVSEASHIPATEFRDQSIAASLKVGSAPGVVGSPSPIPRSIDRGLIEGCRHRSIGAVPAIIPRSIDRGLIEGAQGGAR